MSGSPDYILDLSSVPGEGAGAEDATGPGGGRSKAAGRKWIAVHWKCCHTYSRIYRNADGSAYEGRCPVCARAVRAAVGPGGTTTRFFEAE